MTRVEEIRKRYRIQETVKGFAVQRWRWFRKLKRNIRLWSLIQKIKCHNGVCRFGYQQSGAFFHSPFSFADFDEADMIIALIRLGKLKKTQYIHSTPCNPEYTEFLETPIYNL